MNSVNTQTRRKSARTKVASSEIVYLHFQTANGAVALDVSAEGIGFQAASPLEPNEVLPFRLSVPGFPEVDLSGQIVWLDSTRKRGGMRLSVPPESVALFEKWQRKYLDAAAEPDEIPVSARPSRAPVSGPAFTPQVLARTEYHAPAQPAGGAYQERPVARPAPPPQADAPQASVPPAVSPFARPDSILGTRGSIFVSEWQAPPEPPRTSRNILVALVVIGLCVAIAGGSYYLAGKRAVGNMLINLGQQIGGSSSPSAGARQAASGSQPAAGPVAPDAANSGAGSSSTAAQNATAPSANALSAPAANPNGQTPGATPPSASQPANPGNETQAAMPAAQPTNAAGASADHESSTADVPQSATPEAGSDAAAAPAPDARTQSKSRPAKSSAQATQPAAAAADAGGAELKEALNYLQSPNPQDAAVAEDLLWSAVGAGSAQADLVLGDLYMRGQGAVHRNCRQAEILLHAALVADVAGANQKLDQLQTYGCR